MADLADRIYAEKLARSTAFKASIAFKKKYPALDAWLRKMAKEHEAKKETWTDLTL